MIAAAIAAWRDAWRDKTLRVQIVATPVCLALTLHAFSRFLVWVENRPGTRLSDPLLAAFGARDFTWLIFAIVYLALALGLVALALRPKAMLVAVQAYVVMIVVRMGVMYFTPLDPPEGMIALRDPLTE